MYWPIALMLAYAAIAAFYLRRSRARGVATRVRPYVIAGIIAAVLVTCVSLWVMRSPPFGEPGILGLHLQRPPLGMLSSPGAAIGLALLVLAWAERNRALLALALGYLAIVLIPIGLGWGIRLSPPWGFPPHLVIQGSVLLLGGIGFALAQRPARLNVA